MAPVASQPASNGERVISDYRVKSIELRGHLLFRLQNEAVTIVPLLSNLVNAVLPVTPVAGER